MRLEVDTKENIAVHKDWKHSFYLMKMYVGMNCIMPSPPTVVSSINSTTVERR